MVAPTRTISLPSPHERQRSLLKLAEGNGRRVVCRAGRRGGKTVGASMLACLAYLAGKRVVYASPTIEQTGPFWRGQYGVTKLLAPLIEAGLARVNFTRHEITPAKGVSMALGEGTIKAKTVHDGETLRGGHADLMIYDEFQMMAPENWEEDGQPMLIDTDGTAVFIYTARVPGRVRKRSPSIHYMRDMYARAQTHEGWHSLTFTTHDNPYVSADAIERMSQTMSRIVYRAEIMAEDMDDVPGALWTRDTIRYAEAPAGDMMSTAVGVDPAGSADGTTGIVVVGRDSTGHCHVLADESVEGIPAKWAYAVGKVVKDYHADRVIVEKNYGGLMCRHVLEMSNSLGALANAAVREVTAKRGKALRADPISALYEAGRVSHVRSLPHLEDEMCMWKPDSGMDSPDRMDALVYALTELTQGGERRLEEAMARRRERHR